MIKIDFTSPLNPEANAFLSEETGINFAAQDMRDWFCVTAYNEHDAVVGVAVAEPKTWFDWHFSCAIADQRCMSRRLLRTIFRTIFARAVRITALVDPANETAWRQVRRMGFVYEGFIRLGVEGTRDAMLFGMLAEDCRFLYPGFRAPGTIHRTDFAGATNGQFAQTA